MCYHRSQKLQQRECTFSELNSIEFTESIEFVKDMFLIIFIFKITKNSILQNLKNLKKTIFLVISIFKTTKNSFLQILDSIEFNT